MKFVCTLIFISFIVNVLANSKFTTHKKAIDVPKSTAGFDLKGKNLNPKLRMVNGLSAKNDQFPFVAELSIRKTTGNYLCSASIIKNNWLLTARHCADSGATAVLAFFGSADRYTTTRVQIFGNLFTWLTASDGSYIDIALLQLSQSLTYNTYIKPIRLPSMPQENFRYDGYTYTAVGWGVDSSGNVQRFLQYADFNVLTSSQCNFPKEIGPYCMCSVPANKISAFTGGDSGGPGIIIEADGIETQIGVNVNGASAGALANFGSTRVSSYLRWIQENTGVVYNPDSLVAVGSAATCLSPGQSIKSTSGCYMLIFQTDGNVVLYTKTYTPLWSTGTFGKTATRFCMQPDGNLVLYNVNTPLWNSQTFGNNGAYVKLQIDGNLVVYSKANVALWNSRTNQATYQAKC